MPALQHFFDAERLRRGWSMRDAAKRCKISLSKAYAIVNGDDNVEFDTFENIAAAFGLTPAELAVAIGKGSPEDDPAEARVIALYRQIAAEKRETAADLLSALAAPPARPRAKSRVDASAKRLERRRRELQTGVDQTPDHEPKRRQFAIRKLSTMVLAALGLNRDSGQFAPAT